MDDAVRTVELTGYRCLNALSGGIESTAVFLSMHPAAALCAGVAVVLIIAKLMKS